VGILDSIYLSASDECNRSDHFSLGPGTCGIRWSQTC